MSTDGASELSDRGTENNRLNEGLLHS